MKINLNLNNRQKNIFSVRIKIISKNNIQVIEELLKTNELFIDYSFLNLEKYTLIISVVQLGKQLFKKKYTFTYHECEEYRLDENVAITCGNGFHIIPKNKKNASTNDKLDINPIIIYRNEGKKTSVYVNGNILLLKGNLKKIFTNIKNRKNLKGLHLSNKELENYLNILVEKGCIICYE